jgi:hypothetical protein
MWNIVWCRVQWIAELEVHRVAFLSMSNIEFSAKRVASLSDGRAPLWLPSVWLATQYSCYWTQALPMRNSYSTVCCFTVLFVSLPELCLDFAFAGSALGMTETWRWWHIPIFHSQECSFINFCLCPRPSGIWKLNVHSEKAYGMGRATVIRFCPRKFPSDLIIMRLFRVVTACDKRRKKLNAQWADV